jgi:hypothetical protein
VIGTGPLDGPLRVHQTPSKIPGVSQQTVYSPSATGGLTVLVGTGGPIQSVQHSSGYHQSQKTISEDFDSITAHDRQKYGDRGDQPGYVLTPGQLGEKKL